MSLSRAPLTALLALLAWPAAAAEDAAPDSLRPEAAETRATVEKSKRTSSGTQTVDVVRWMSKRRQFTLNGVPYGFTGLPIAYYSPNTGWNYGARVQWVSYQGSYQDRRPYRYKLTLYLLRSTEGSRNSTLRLKVPRISGTGFGLRLLLATKKNLRTRYYGLGNDTEYNAAYTDPASPDFRDKNYYYYVLETPRFIFSLLREIYGPVSVSVGLGLDRADVSARGGRSSYRDQQAEVGAVEGSTGFLSGTIHWDTRDDDTIPRRGTFHEWSYETSRNSLLGVFLEQLIDFRRYTFTDTRHVPLSKRLNLAHRMVFEVLKGSVPLYAYGEIGGSRRIKGLGGTDSLRGYDRQRFTDNVRFFSNTELRYQLATLTFFKQYLEWHGVGFVDAGRVWPDTDQVGLGGLHATVGAGLRFYWNSDFVIRADFGYSSERTYTALKYRNLF